MNSLFKIVTDSVTPNDFHISHQSILVQDLELVMSIGVLDEEKEKPQRVIVNIDLEIDNEARPTSDNINEVISYAEIIDNVKALSQSKHYELVETLANDIAISCLNMGEQAQKVSISVQKPDIISDANVGISLTAQK